MLVDDRAAAAARSRVIAVVHAAGHRLGARGRRGPARSPAARARRASRRWSRPWCTAGRALAGCVLVAGRLQRPCAGRPASRPTSSTIPQPTPQYEHTVRTGPATSAAAPVRAGRADRADAVTNAPFTLTVGVSHCRHRKNPRLRARHSRRSRAITSPAQSPSAACEGGGGAVAGNNYCLRRLVVYAINWAYGEATGARRGDGGGKSPDDGGVPRPRGCRGEPTGGSVPLMCGIAGWIAYEKDLTAEREVLDAMTRTMSCRGPDAGGAWADTHAALGHRRLAVIDIEGGKQPMAVERDGRTVLVTTYSGEIYNYRELRAELTRPRAHASAPAATPRWCCTPIWSGATSSPSGSTACTPSRCGSRASSSCCWSATAWASSRCTTTRPRTGCSSARSRRRSWPIRR